MTHTCQNPLRVNTPHLSLFLNSKHLHHLSLFLNSFSRKNHVTLKALVGCTPSGGYSFVSQLFTGSISDVEIVKQSGFLISDQFNSDQFDSVMADRGFIIENDLPDGVSLNIPAFLNGRTQFGQGEVI